MGVTNIKRVAVINDLSGFGKCSLTAAISVLSVMGHEACPMPTAVLTNQTGYKDFFSVDMTDTLPNYARMWQMLGKSFDSIYSGFVSSERQIEIISDFIDKFRKSDTLVLVDPVMGDNGKSYATYTKSICDRMCNLAKSADIITPNLTEFCIITETDYAYLNSFEQSDLYLEKISDIAMSYLKKTGQQIVVTGINTDNKLYNGVFSKDKQPIFISSAQYGNGFSGTGDLMASVICGSVLNGLDLVQAVKKASVFIENSVVDTIQNPYDRNDGINFEKYLHTLANI
ncbi:MAG: pyridoxamine kinase [Ruminococcus sp.]|nr:pyridoxamine kinase [Ruminococcus sp.]